MALDLINIFFQLNILLVLKTNFRTFWEWRFYTGFTVYIYQMTNNNPVN